MSSLRSSSQLSITKRHRGWTSASPPSEALHPVLTPSTVYGFLDRRGISSVHFDVTPQPLTVMSPRPIDSASSAQEYLRSLIPPSVPKFNMQAAARGSCWSSGPFLHAHTTAAHRALINGQNSASSVGTAESSTVGGRSGYVGDAESEVGDARLADYAGKAPPVQTANRKKVSQNLTKKSGYWGDEVDDEEAEASWETTSPLMPMGPARRFHVQPATKRIDQSGIQKGAERESSLPAAVKDQVHGEATKAATMRRLVSPLPQGLRTKDLPSAFSASSSEGDRPIKIAVRQTVAPELADLSLSPQHSPNLPQVPSPFAHGLTAEDLLSLLSVTVSPDDEAAAGIPIPSRTSGVTDVDAEKFVQCTTVASALSSVPGFRRVVVATSVLLF
ncbi:hypothetical protein BJ546DRAFT_949333 [Cryomyces antarcticus]